MINWGEREIRHTIHLNPQVDLWLGRVGSRVTTEFDVRAVKPASNEERKNTTRKAGQPMLSAIVRLRSKLLAAVHRYLLFHDDVPERIANRVVLFVYAERARRPVRRCAWQLCHPSYQNLSLSLVDGWGEARTISIFLSARRVEGSPVPVSSVSRSMLSRREQAGEARCESEAEVSQWQTTWTDLPLLDTKSKT